MNFFALEVTFSIRMHALKLPYAGFVGFTVPKLHKSTLTVILYMFVTQTMPHLERASYHP